MTKPKNYNKKNIVKNLDLITSNVAKRGVYVVNKKEHVFFVQNYVSKEIVIDDIPIRDLAEKICRYYNNGKNLRIETKNVLRELIKNYYRYKTELIFYKNSMHSEKDNFKIEILEARFCLTRGRYTAARQKLEEF